MPTIAALRREKKEYDMEPLDIMLIVLVVAGIWAIVELALTIRKARTSIDELAHSATDAVDQATPIIAKLDGVVDELQPALREVPSLVDSANTCIDTANVSLGSLNNILGDVSSATSGIAGVGESASRIVGTATSAAVGVVSKVASFGGITIPEGQNLIGKGSGPKPENSSEEAPSDVAPSSAVADAEPAHKAGYVTYAPVSAQPDVE